MTDRSINKDLNYDMATTAKSPTIIPQFSGKSDEDVSTWARDARFICQLYKLDDVAGIRSICQSLSGAAFSWIREELTRNANTTIENIILGLESRFSSRLHLTTVAQRFQCDLIPNNIEDYFKMIQDANYLCERNYMSIHAIIDKLIIRSPPDIRSIIIHSTGEVTSIHEISKIIERILPLTYSKNGQNIISDVQKVSTSKFSEKNFKAGKTNSTNSLIRYCELHGKCNHNTNECRTIKTLEEKGWKRFKNIRETSVEDVVEESNSFNKNNSFYIFNNIKAIKHLNNPFMQTGEINSKKIQILIDSGADTSLFNIKHLPENSIIQPTNSIAISANGSKLNIKGKISNIPIYIQNEKILIEEALVVVGEPNHVILGADSIIKNPNLIIKILKIDVDAFAKHNNLVYEIRNYDDVKAISKYDDLFQTELNKLTLCNIGRHTIDTNASRPIWQNNNRIPINWEAPIDQEIKRLLLAGIIRESKALGVQESNQ